MVATVVAIIVVDRGGRRMLFFEGGVQMALAEVCMAGLIAWNFRAGAGALTSPVRPRAQPCSACWKQRPFGICMASELPGACARARRAHLCNAYPPAAISNKSSRTEGGIKSGMARTWPAQG